MDYSLIYDHPASAELDAVTDRIWAQYNEDRKKMRALFMEKHNLSPYEFDRLVCEGRIVTEVSMDESDPNIIVTTMRFEPRKIA